jgi:hypothetical protein
MFKYLFSFLRREPASNSAKFEIEYYPLSKKYFCKVNGSYLKKHYLTGIVQTTDFDLLFADSFITEDEAMKLIELYKEQKFKKTVVVTEIK